MATWVEPIESETDPDAPLKSELAKRWDNNVVALAEGSSGAPRVQGKALGNVYMGRIDLSTGGGFNGLDGYGALRGDWAATTTRILSEQVLRVRYSNDNGATYGPYQSLAKIASTQGASSAASCGSLRVNLQTGEWSMNGMASTTPSSVGDTTHEIIFGSGTHTVPSGCNAVRFEVWGAGEGSLLLDCIGGLE